MEIILLRDPQTWKYPQIAGLIRETVTFSEDDNLSHFYDMALKGQLVHAGGDVFSSSFSVLSGDEGNGGRKSRCGFSKCLHILLTQGSHQH